MKSLYMFKAKTIKMIFEVAGGLGKMLWSIKSLTCKN